MLSDDNTSNPKRFWSFIKNKRTESTGVAPLRREGILHSDTATKANILNDQFTSVFSSEQGGDIPTKGNSPYSSVPDITVHQAGVYKLLYNINQHKATGPDTIPGKLLKELASEISPILTTIYNASIKQGKIPNQWKEALITPLFKKVDRGKASNYRPVSQTSICCMIMEHNYTAVTSSVISRQITSCLKINMDSANIDHAKANCLSHSRNLQMN
jgi:hypothetical protein